MRTYIPTFEQYLNEAIFDPALLQEFNKVIDEIEKLYRKVNKYSVDRPYGTMDKFGAHITLDFESEDVELPQQFVVQGHAIKKEYDNLFFVFTERREPGLGGEFHPTPKGVRNKLIMYGCRLNKVLLFDKDVFRHEMIHYKDYLRNDHKFSKVYDFRKHDMQKYMSTPHEYLAHTQETIMHLAGILPNLPMGVTGDFKRFLELIDQHKILSKKEVFDKKYRRKYRKHLYKVWTELRDNNLAYKLILNIASKNELPYMSTTDFIEAIKQIQDNDSEFIINWKRKYFKRTLNKIKRANDKGNITDFDDKSEELDVVIQQSR